MPGAIRWELLAVFAATWLAIALYGLTAAGHFPREHRSARMCSALGTLVLWASMTIVALSAMVALVLASRRLPWAAAVISGGVALLMAPLCLQALPDRFVDGRRGLLSFAVAAGALSAAALAL